MINNIKHKYTTGAGLVILFYVIAKLCGLNLEERLDMPFDDIVVVVGGALSAILHIFSKDPKDKKNDREN